jgi:ornithine cyclodeaminase
MRTISISLALQTQLMVNPMKAHTKTTFLSPDDIAYIVQTNGMKKTMEDLTAYITQDFLRWNAFEKSARVANHTHDGVIELMPISDKDCYAFKYVNGHPKNTHVGLPTVMAFGVLAAMNTGMPELVSELTLTTALRTAATSVMAAKVLARKNSASMAIIGNGAQSEFQALAFHYLLGIKELRLFDIDADATHKMIKNLSHTPMRLVPCNSTTEAVFGADIITTITADKTNATILTPEMIQPGVHINGVGGDCPGKTELHVDILLRSSVFVEYEPQTRIEGELQQLPENFAVTEIWKVLQGTSAGRTDDNQVTVFDSVGFALEDYSSLRYMRDAAASLGLINSLSLIPDLENPKDLYRLIVGAAQKLVKIK